jgi:putative Mg2+ transporter-C (MgtC) family protein
MQIAFGEPTGQGWSQIGELLIAFVLALLIGLEREVQQKSAGLRTYTLVGIGSALFVLVSKYGFSDVLGAHTTLDPSRVAAQIVSGLGFLGAGLIFVRRDAVRGLTTAASVWLVAAVGAAAAAGLPLLAAITTALYFFVMYAGRPLQSLARRFRPNVFGLRITYLDGRGLLRDIINAVTNAGFVIEDMAATHVGTQDVGQGRGREDQRVPMVEMAATVEVVLVLAGRGELPALTATLNELSGIVGVETTPPTTEA